MNRGIGTSISNLVDHLAKRGGSITEVVDVFKRADATLLPPSTLDIFHAIPSTAFIKQGDDMLTSTGKRLGTWSQEFRSGLTDVFENSVRDIQLPPNANYSELKLLNNASFPDGDIILTDLKRVDDGRVIGNETETLNRMGDDELNAAANKPANDNALANLWSKAKTAGSVVLVTGAVVGVGLYLSDLINDAIDLNSGCFLVSKENGKTVWKRIIGYSCGNKNGDDLWTSQGLPTIKHPLDAYFDKPICSGEGTCNNYCVTDNLKSPAKEHLDLIPDNSTLLCHTATISEVIGDIATGIGSDIGTITGGVINGVTGGLVSGLGFNWSWLLIIIIGIVIIFGIVAAIKAFKK